MTRSSVFSTLAGPSLMLPLSSLVCFLFLNDRDDGELNGTLQMRAMLPHALPRLVILLSASLITQRLLFHPSSAMPPLLLRRLFTPLSR